MNIDNDTVKASIAARALIHLYDVYRASSRAQIAAVQQIRRHVSAGNDNQTLSRTKLAELKRREALMWHTDAVFAERREQVRRRLYELQDIPELP